MRDDDDDVEEKPLTPEVERVRRKLMRLMIFSVAITMVLILAVLATVVYKIMSPSAEETVAITKKTEEIPPVMSSIPNISGQTLQTEITLPEGAKIISQSLSGNILSLQILMEDQTTEFLIYDYSTARYVAKVNVKN